MKRRIIITVVAVALFLLYQFVQPEAEDFSGEDLMQVRDSDVIDYIISDDEGVLVFWDNGPADDSEDKKYSLAVDYFKPGFNKWNWVNGGMHSTSVSDGITYQYIPKQSFKKFAFAFGVVVNQEIEEMKIEATNDSSYAVQIIELSNKTIWFLRLSDDIRKGEISCYNTGGELIYKLDIDNEWILGN